MDNLVCYIVASSRNDINLLTLMSLDWIKAAEILKKYWRNNAQVDDEHSTDKGTMIVVCIEILYVETTSVYC